jgi:hypothetical protein
MRLSGPLRLSGYRSSSFVRVPVLFVCPGTVVADAGGWFAWLRDAERRGDEGRAAPVRSEVARSAVAGDGRYLGALARTRGRAAPVRAVKARAGLAASRREKVCARKEVRGRQPPTEYAGLPGRHHQARRADERPPAVAKGYAGSGRKATGLRNVRYRHEAATGLRNVRYRHEAATGLRNVRCGHEAATGLRNVRYRHEAATGLRNVRCGHEAATGLRNGPAADDLGPGPMRCRRVVPGCPRSAGP